MMDPMSGFDIPLVFTLAPGDGTLQYKRCFPVNYFISSVKFIFALYSVKVCEYECFQ